MERTRTITPPPPPEIAARIKSLGLRIRDARIRRKLRQSDLAYRVSLSRSTIEAIERGSPKTSIGAYVHVLWLLGLDRELDIVADYQMDAGAAILEYKLGERRVRVHQPVDNNF